MDKEKWMHDVLNSTKGIKRAEPGSFLFPKITGRIKTGDIPAAYIPLKKAILIFTSIFVLAILNLGTILYKNSQTNYTTYTETSTSDYIPSQQNPYLEIFK
jgi:hypothetical protein